MVGFGSVLQHKPRKMTADPPSFTILPPLTPEFTVTEAMSLVDKAASPCDVKLPANSSRAVILSSKTSTYPFVAASDALSGSDTFDIALLPASGVIWLRLSGISGR